MKTISVSSALVGITLVAFVSGQEGVPTDDVAFDERANSKNPIDAFIATYTNKWVASALQSVIDEQSSLLFKHPGLHSQVLSIENEFVNDLHGDNALAHFSTFASKMEKLNGGSENRPMFVNMKITLVFFAVGVLSQTVPPIAAPAADGAALAAAPSALPLPGAISAPAIAAVTGASSPVSANVDQINGIVASVQNGFTTVQNPLATPTTSSAPTNGSATSGTSSGTSSGSSDASSGAPSGTASSSGSSDDSDDGNSATDDDDSDSGSATESTDKSHSTSGTHKSSSSHSSRTSSEESESDDQSDSERSSSTRTSSSSSETSQSESDENSSEDSSIIEESSSTNAGVSRNKPLDFVLCVAGAIGAISLF
ncbi:hypothetical protein GGI16_001221 [Coemansia sp. S142-1]|nr:hypothetical protein GGI16_001221 [Coemansia sp. S142-1]